MGRTALGDGTEFFTAQPSTLGAANADPLDPPVLISRILLLPGDGVQWVELTNGTGARDPL